MGMKRQDLLEDCVLELADRLDRIENVVGLLLKATAEILELAKEDEGVQDERRK